MKNILHIVILLFLPFSLFGQQFIKIESSPITSDGGDSRSVNWIDYDNDGDLDLFITNGPRNGQNNFLYDNQGDGTFIKIDSLAITRDKAPSDGSTWGDFNNDGYADLFVANWYNKNNLLYLNMGNNAFELQQDTVTNHRGYSETGALIDINNDGFLDLIVANSFGTRRNFVYLNSTKESFSNWSLSPITSDIGSSRHLDWCDYDSDGFVDLFIPNENNEKNFLYHNNGDNTFSRETTGLVANEIASSFGSSWGDYDNDGDLDLFVTNWSNLQNYLYKNNGEGNFVRVLPTAITSDFGYSIGSAWGDVDNDGDLDLFATNGFSPNKTTNFLYINNGNGSFTKGVEIITTEKGWSYGASFGDYNRDGYLDLAVAKCFSAKENNSLFVNTGGSNNWITLKLEGTVSNRSAIMAVVRAKAIIGGKSVLQTRQVSGQDGYCGQNLEIHFGLGNATIIDSLTIFWPSGQSQTQTDVQVNQHLSITETTPAGFLRSHFKAEKRSVSTNEQVNFRNLSITDENTPILSWEWDFNNDGIVDSEEASPSWRYQTMGVFTVNLLVSNGTKEERKTFEDYISVTGSPTSIETDNNQLPSNHKLYNNYPNPFNPTTSIEYEIGKAGFVEISVYNPLGMKIGSLINETMTSGHYKASFNATNLPSGIYFYRLSVGDKIFHSKKMLLMK